MSPLFGISAQFDILNKLLGLSSLSRNGNAPYQRHHPARNSRRRISGAPAWTRVNSARPARGLRHRPRLHGHVGLVRPGRPQREHRHHPRRARRRRHPARHRRLLRHGPQRDADRRGARGAPPRQSADQREVRRPARPGRRPGSATTPPGGGEELRSPTRCSGSASTTSTSTGRRGSIRTCRSRTRSARSPTW